MSSAPFCLAFCLLVSDLGSSPLENQVLVIDLRTKESFTRLHIENSIQMSLGELIHKQWLGNRPIQLVGEATDDLSVAIAKLQSAGFPRVSPLDGGLYGYFLAGGHFRGDLSAVATLGTLDALSFMNLPDREDWVLVGITTDNPNESLIQVGDQDPQIFLSNLEAVVKAHQGQRILLIDEDGEMSEEIWPLLRLIKNPGLFYLAEGKEGLARVSTQLKEPGGLRLASHGKPAPFAGPAEKKSCGCKK